MSTFKKVSDIEEALASGIPVSSLTPLEVINAPATQLGTDLVLVGGTAVTTDAGGKGAGTLRVTVASDDTLLQSMRDDLTTLGATVASNQVRTSTDALGGFTVDLGVGAAGLGTQRVAVARETLVDGQGVHMRKNPTVHDVFPVRMYGHRDAVTTTYSSIAAGHPAVTRNLSANNAAMFIVSTSANDTNTAGTGVRSVEVIYSSNSGAPLSETLNLNGQTPVPLATDGNAVFTVTATITGTGHSNAGVVSLYAGTATAGVPDTPTAVFADMQVGTCQAEQSDWHASTTENYYPDKLWFYCDGLAWLRIQFWEHKGVGFNNHCERVLFESQFPAGTHNMDLSSMGQLLEGVVRVQAKADAGTVDVSYSLTGYSDNV